MENKSDFAKEVMLDFGNQYPEKKEEFDRFIKNPPISTKSIKMFQEFKNTVCILTEIIINLKREDGQYGNE